MSELKFITPPQGHECGRVLPSTQAYRAGTLARCTCGRWHFVSSLAVPHDRFYWTPVRWYHFRRRRAIRRGESDA